MNALLIENISQKEMYKPYYYYYLYYCFYFYRYFILLLVVKYSSSYLCSAKYSVTVVEFP